MTDTKNKFWINIFWKIKNLEESKWNYSSECEDSEDCDVELEEELSSTGGEAGSLGGKVMG